MLLFFLGGLLLVASLFWPGKSQTWVAVTVESGMTAHDVLAQLQEKDLLKSRIPFLVWMRLRQADSKIHMGRYKIEKGRSAYWIVQDLIKGETEKVRLVIPEGFASWQIAQRLDELDLCNGTAFLKIVRDQQLEGFLFPATYELEHGLLPEIIAREMKNQFDRRWTPEMAARAKAWGWTEREAVTFASILEREVRVHEELPQVSSVYHNRLKKRMRLEADPTVQYAMGFWKERLSYDDYRNTKSPYNTYLNSGLPPGPICNPGVDALRAALWPAATDALFFLATGDGRHTFSRTYKDHTNKVNARNRGQKKNMVERKR